jgi:rSAM/selenodomain-associated transferase 2
MSLPNDQNAPLSVIIPTRNAQESLPATLTALADGALPGLIREVIVVDGGSGDATQSLAAGFGARVLLAVPGRGQQLAAAASEATGSWLLFLHADTCLAGSWGEAASAFLGSATSENAGPDAGEPAVERAAVFRFALDDTDPRARRIEGLARWRGRVLALPYGDQGLLISRAFYHRLGGYRPISLMEDVDLVRRIGRRRLTTLDADAATSARRYRADGWYLRPLRNLSLLALYYLGLPTSILTRLYG